MKIIILRREQGEKRLRIKDVSPGSFLYGKPLKEGGQLSLEDLVPLAKEGFSIILAQHDELEASGPLRN